MEQRLLGVNSGGCLWIFSTNPLRGLASTLLNGSRSRSARTHQLVTELSRVKLVLPGGGRPNAVRRRVDIGKHRVCRNQHTPRRTTRKEDGSGGKKHVKFRVRVSPYLSERQSVPHYFPPGQPSNTKRKFPGQQFVTIDTRDNQTSFAYLHSRPFEHFPQCPRR